MSASSSVLLSILVLVAGAMASLVTAGNRRRSGWVALAATTVAAGLSIWAAVAALVWRGQVAPVLWRLPDLGSQLRLQVDGLSGLFLILIAVVSVLAALFSISYLDHYGGYSVARYYPHFQIFVAGMVGIVTVTDLMVFFCAFWQIMTLSSFGLVRFEHRKRENRRAAWRYLVMMEIACALVMGGAALLADRSGPARFDFDNIGASLAGAADSSGLGWALALFLVGFGIKAGMWPFGQLWLPDAHPVAPSPVSALLSGVMIKTGVYGLARTFLWLVPRDAWVLYPSAAWGAALAVLGTVTLFVGTLQALKQEQSKRLLAFHSIGQVGYILLGLGACVALLHPADVDGGARILAALALCGALYHTLNHGAFKSLLFLNAGTMLGATGTQDLNALGGLMRYMPVTGITALIASCSIAGIPGFNGFASKWSLYVPTVLGSRELSYLPVLGVIAILTSALTLASFVKFFGMAFLTRSSQLVRERAAARGGMLEPDRVMCAPQIVLAAVCVVLGLFPALAFGLLRAVLHASGDGLVAILDVGPHMTRTAGVMVDGGVAVLAPLVIVVIVGAAMGLARALSRVAGAERRPAEPWLCGYAPEAESNRYRAHGMYGEVKRYLGWVGGGARSVPQTQVVAAAPPREAGEGR